MELRGLREARYRAAMTQAELAQVAGVSAPTISSLEQGKSRARPSTIRRLAEALGVWPEELIGEGFRRRSEDSVVESSHDEDG